MTQQEKQIKITEACGWIDIYLGSRKGNRTPVGNTLWGTKDAPSINYGREYVIVPDYFHDLNAMHEAIATLTDSQGVIFCCELNLMGIFGEWDILKATPSQLAEAFGKTLSLW